MSGGHGSAGGQAGGFFGALFDFSFTRFATPMITKAVYVLLMAFIVLWYLFIAVQAFSAGPGFGVFWLLVIGPIAALVMLAVSRLTLEFYLAVVRVAQDLRELKDGRATESTEADRGR